MGIYSSEAFQNCWLAYFDLLGFKNLLETYKVFPQAVLKIYKEVLQYLDRSIPISGFAGRLIDYCWFSDTFLFWSGNDLPEAFPVIEQAASLFFESLIMNKIPARGSITFGQFYADKDESIYMGQALIDAYKYAEKQQWVNFVLTPMLCNDLSRIGLDPGKMLNYYPISDCFQTRVFPQIPPNFDSSKTLAFTYCPQDTMINYLHKSLKNLSAQCSNEEAKITNKYENSLSWLEFQKERFSK